MAAHDLKAPTTNISVLADMIYSRHFANEETKDLFEKLKISINQLHKKVHTLNYVIESKSNLNGSSECLLFADVFDLVRASIANQIEQAGATITQDFTKCPEISFSSPNLESIMQNLLTNAIKFRDPTRALRIDVKTIRDNDFIKLIFSDNGLGFDVDKHGDKIMKPFSRLHSNIEGQGIGLYLIKSIISTNGGHIKVESQPNRGTQFTIYLKHSNEEYFTY